MIVVRHLHRCQETPRDRTRSSSSVLDTTGGYPDSVFVMDRTQMLFIILSVVLVGVAAAVAIHQFGPNPITANRTYVALDYNDIANKAQRWYQAPANVGGG